MDLLFKREQTTGKIGRVNFKLWGKVEFDEGENEIVRRYRFDEAALIEVLQPGLIRMTGLVAFGAFVLALAVFNMIAGFGFSFFVAVIAGGGVGYWYLNENRETIYVKDLIHGRYFSCVSVVELARQEAYLRYVSGYLRQVMESAKHWDGTERTRIDPLPKDEAMQVILKGL